MGYALDLLNKKDEFPKPFINELYNPALMGAAGVGMFLFANWMNRKPLISGVHRHVIGLFSGIALGFYVNKKRDEYYAERDAVLRHYVELHPEDFPDPQRKKYKDIWMQWQPIR